MQSDVKQEPTKLSSRAQFFYNQIMGNIDTISERGAIVMINANLSSGNINNKEAEEIRNRLGL